MDFAKVANGAAHRPSRSEERSRLVSDDTLFDAGPVINEPDPPKRERGKVIIDISFDAVHLSEEELWPDGDAPDEWDAEDVQNLIREVGLGHCGLDLLDFCEAHADVSVLDALEGKKKYA